MADHGHSDDDLTEFVPTLVEVEPGQFVVTRYDILEPGDWCEICVANAKSEGCHWWGNVARGHASVEAAWVCWESRENRTCADCGEELGEAWMLYCRPCWDRRK
jgi:hypothetical protein